MDSMEARSGEISGRARVLIAGPNSAYGDEPYTRQPGGCGQEGDFIHFTPEYLVKKSIDDRTYKPAKKIVKEFAKLKWGLFDENIPANDNTSSWFYSVGDELRLIGCVKEIEWNSEGCRVYNSTAFYKPCKVIPKKIDGNASLLSYEFLDEVIGFCTMNGEESGHNILPTNNQNKNCEHKSAWAVMNTLDDFKSSINHTREPEFSSVPIINVVQDILKVNLTCRQDVVCLCIDISGSMTRAKRIAVMSQAVKLYLMTYIRDGSAVGIVSFNDTAMIDANMTLITSQSEREGLISKVPTRADGDTNIAAGISTCQKILTKYTKGNLDSASILLHSDGEGNIEKDLINTSIAKAINAGIRVDTVLFGQGGLLAEGYPNNSGMGFLSSDTLGQVHLLDFYINTTSRFCQAESREAVVKRESVTIPAGIATYRGEAYFDKTIGLNTKMVFIYDNQISVLVSDNLSTEVSKKEELNFTVIVIKDEIDQAITYTITKHDQSVSTSIITVISALPFPGIEAIEFSSRVNSRSFEFNPSTELISYIGVFQGFSPVLKLDIRMLFEDPSGRLTSIMHTDDGRGGVIVIRNWSLVPDTTPPDRITDLSVLEASEETGVFVLGWTAPGEDLNLGQASGYNFGVGTNLSANALVSIDEDVILTPVSTLLVESGRQLQLVINASKLTPDMFGLPKTENISTYYFRIKAYDSNDNYAKWSNPVSASFLTPNSFAGLIEETSTSMFTGQGLQSSLSTVYANQNSSTMFYASTSSRNETDVTEVAEVFTSPIMLLILGVSVVIAGLVIAAVTVAIILVHRRSGKKESIGRELVIKETVIGTRYLQKDPEKEM
ncbi:calcium-activated chloride channel regulator 1-like [Watersipora subatra]|uniref:calcium-activated chloride channel regulator 1-like n=1 Tax=Watersipora subatra TaxID=2589382 RepID=UPI00355B337A